MNQAADLCEILRLFIKQNNYFGFRRIGNKLGNHFFQIFFPGTRVQKDFPRQLGPNRAAGTVVFQMGQDFAPELECGEGAGAVEVLHDQVAVGAHGHKFAGQIQSQRRDIRRFKAFGSADHASQNRGGDMFI